MSGEPQRDDDPDFLDDFILEDDAAAKDEDLDQLFEAPAPAPAAATAQPPAAPPPKTRPVPAPSAGAPAGDAEDLLFTDHTRGLETGESFAAAPGFAEQAPSAWRGDGLELDAPGVPADGDGGSALERGEPLPAEAAEAKFTAELDSLLQSDDELGLDSENDLELIEAADALPDEVVQPADTFVIDDGGGTWQQEEAATTDEPLAAEAASPDATEAVEMAPAAEVVDDVAAAPLEDAELQPLDAAAETLEPGWEPLPGTNMDELAEVDEVAPTEDEAETAAAEDAPLVAAAAVGADVDAGGGARRRPALVGAGAPVPADELEELYAEAAEAAPAAVVGGRRTAGRTLRLVGSLAASVAVLGGAALAVLRPEWFGLRFEPEQAQRVQVERPRLEMTVPTPPPVAEPTPPVEAPSPVVVTVPPPVSSTPPVEPSPAVPTPAPTTTEVAPVPAPPANTEVTPAPVPTPTEPPPAPPTEPAVVPNAEPSTAVVVPVPAPVADEADPKWPVAAAQPNSTTPSVAGGNAGKPGLIRIGDDLLVGAQETGPARAVEGMLPGSRAFAQLHNGNYFIGSVKSADRERITLRVGTGEVTLQTAAIAKLTELGSADYDELQKVTSGFVRLTNNNRLVGGILSGIADDHIVLEFRSNRVMLPKSAIGEVVEGDDDATVRLRTTREEDDWLRQLAERQLGTGTAPIEAKPKPTPPAGAPGGK